MILVAEGGIAELLRVSGAATYRLWDDYRTRVVEERPATAAETALLVSDENAQAIRDKAAQALGINASYLALNNPTNAQNLAQVRVLTRECNGLIRLMLGLLDDASGT